MPRIAAEIIGCWVLSRPEPVAPKVAQLLLDAEADLLGFYALPREHWSKLRSTNPLERSNREIGRRTDEGRYPYVWLDGKIEKVRERGGVRQKCLAARPPALWEGR